MPDEKKKSPWKTIAEIAAAFTAIVGLVVAVKKCAETEPAKEVGHAEPAATAQEPPPADVRAPHRDRTPDDGRGEAASERCPDEEKSARRYSSIQLGFGAAGYLSLNTSAPTDVWVDGYWLGKTPIVRAEIAAGGHALTFKVCGNVVHEASIDVEAGTEKRLIVEVPANAR